MTVTMAIGRTRVFFFLQKKGRGVATHCLDVTCISLAWKTRVIRARRCGIHVVTWSSDLSTTDGGKHEEFGKGYHGDSRTLESTLDSRLACKFAWVTDGPDGCFTSVEDIRSVPTLAK